MKRFIHLLLIAIILFVSNACSISQALRLKDCEYSYVYTSDLTFMDIPSRNLLSISGARTITKALTGQYDKVTMGATVHLKVTNPNKKTASLDKLYYTVYLDNLLIAEGCSAVPAVITGNNYAIIPLALNVDVNELLSKHSRSTIERLVKNFLHLSDTPSTITINLKPMVRIGGASVSICKPIPLTFKYGG